MNKILGLDLGTNSIGWAIRDTGESENQIIDKGVLTFEKGVGEGKSGEFPLVQKRTESRSKRRNYQAEKYRKWALLQTLIEQGMCPLSMVELDEWRKYTKGTGRKYPQSEPFVHWLRYDFDADGKPDLERFGFSKHENHYLFRMLAVSEKKEHKIIFLDNPHVLGRVLYHLVQRRGFRGRDEEEAKTIMQGSKDSGTQGVDVIVPFIQEHKTLGAALYYLQKQKGERIRKRYNLRSDYEKELKEICHLQNIDEAIYKQLWKAIIWQRPLRTQKGLIGVCTFENNKPRCPISHPLYEEYRTWIFINNLKIKFDTEAANLLEKHIYPLFYNASRDFKLKTIATELRKIKGRITSRAGSDESPDKEKAKLENTKVVSATLLNNFDTLLGKDWKEKYGWKEALENRPKTCNYSFEDIWHILFTFDDREKLISFAKDKLGMGETEAEKFSKIKLPLGYATLSLSAIKKLLPYLRQGFLYSHAVYLANLHKVLGKTHIDHDEAASIAISLEGIFRQSANEKLLIATSNALISDQLSSSTRFGMDPSYQLDDDDKKDIWNKLETTYGEKTWSKKSEDQKKEDYDYVSAKYLSFLQTPVAYTKNKLFIRSIPLHDRIFIYLQDAYNVPDKNKKYLWHPSEQETYLPARSRDGIPQLGDPQPLSRGFKNPMALKTLHKLKHLINYLLIAGKMDEDTRVVVEIARELNDSNKRKAIEKWQRDREKENDEYRLRIKEIADEYHLSLDITQKAIIDKYRLWIEQNKTCLYTGAIISCTELFDGSKYDVEHTIPASISFDNELKNLTIADGTYNKQIKGNKFPTQLPNYTQPVLGYQAIYARLEFMEKKVADLETLQEDWKNKTKFASTKDIKDACIQRRHLIRFELDYWRYKLHTFTLTEYKAGWRNSQLRDTQIVTKYALPYLKTIFNKVDVEKGTVTAAFREIYEIYPRKEKKDRDKHSHHAIDAAVLTLIPPAAIRDKILLHYNQLKDQNPNETYHELVRDWKSFNNQFILSIEDDVLINFQPQNRTLTTTYKNVRKRGRIQYVKEKFSDGQWQYKLNETGKRIPLVAKGDSIRGQLHKESLFGVIELKGEKLLVERCAISSFTSIKDCRHIVDDTVRKIVQETLESRLAEGDSFDKAKFLPIPFPNGKAIIKKIRCKVPAGAGYLSIGKALEISRREFTSKHDYKQYSYAQNEENTLCLYYEESEAEKKERGFRIIGLYELAQLKIKDYKSLQQEIYYQSLETGKGKNKKSIPLVHILTVGTKVIICKKEKEELKTLNQQELYKRVFRIYKFNEPAPSTVYVYLQNHLEARRNEELGNGEKDVDIERYQSRIFLGAAKFNCAIEGRDFSMDIDGRINWKF
jgi:CRISPR-associated endonuclease Csn1